MKFTFYRTYSERTSYIGKFVVDAENKEAALELLDNDEFYYLEDSDCIDCSDFDWEDDFDLAEMEEVE